MVGLYVESTRFNCQVFKVNKIVEHRVEINLENDTDGFEFVISNTNGEINGVFSTFDYIKITMNNGKLMKGMIDTVKYDTDAGTVTITGRDLACILVDNDALPDTLSVNPITYTKNKCKEYGISYHPYLTIPKKVPLTIGTGESEISIINNLLLTDKQRLWYMYDTLYSGTWNTGAKPTCSFVRGDTKKVGIRIESLTLTEDSKNTKSEIKIYGSVNDGKEHIVGSAKNPGLVSRGIVRRMTKRSSDNDSASKYSASALREVRDSLRDNISIEIRCYVGKSFILPNNTAYVYDDQTGIDGKFFIYSVEYILSATDGNIMVISMIPQDDTFDIIWKSQGKGNSLTKTKKK